MIVGVDGCEDDHGTSSSSPVSQLYIASSATNGAQQSQISIPVMVLGPFGGMWGQSVHHLATGGRPLSARTAFPTTRQSSSEKPSLSALSINKSMMWSWSARPKS